MRVKPDALTLLLLFCHAQVRSLSTALHLHGCRKCNLPYPKEVMTVTATRRGSCCEFDGVVQLTVQAAQPIPKASVDSKAPDFYTQDCKTQVDFTLAARNKLVSTVFYCIIWLLVIC